MEITNEDIQRGREAEGRNEKMNMMNSAQKANSPLFNQNYDGIFRKPTLPMLEWYGYKHVTGTIHLKRYRPELQAGDINEAIESDFVILVKGPFEAESREEALKILRRELGE